MLIKIGSKEYVKENMELLDTINRFSWQEFDYYTESLYKTPEGEYILETSYQLSHYHHKDELEDGVLNEDDFTPKMEYRTMPTEEAEVWLEDVLWEV